MIKTETDHQYYGTSHEKEFIDSIEPLPDETRLDALKRYHRAALKRVNWLPIKRDVIIEYVESLINA